MISVDYFWIGQRVIKASGKYAGIVGVVVSAYPHRANIKTLIRVKIVGDIGTRGDVYLYFKRYRSVRYWRPATFLMSNRYTKGNRNE